MVYKNNDYYSADFSRIMELIGRQKISEAINELERLTDLDRNNLKALALLEYLEKIVEYRNKDIFSSTNLDMDPWLE